MNFENLPEEYQLQIKLNSIVLALKKTLITSPELQEIFDKHYEDALNLVKSKIDSKHPKELD